MPQRPEKGAGLDLWLSYLEALHPTEIDLGLDRVLMVLRRLFPRRPEARIITIGGTNGKGSTVAALERLLLDSGRSVGAYTSPHLLRYNERVRINGTDVSDEVLVSAFEAVEQARKNVSLTYFEFGTLAAFVALANAGVEDWILEVGLGGRLDAVNVLDADLAILTSVDLDHVAWLGNDRDTIGFEKAGILRPDQAAIYADEDPPRSVLQQAAAQRVQLKRYGIDYRVDNLGGSTRFVSEGGSWQATWPTNRLPVKSLAAAVQAMRILSPETSSPLISESIGKVVLAGRFEQRGTSPHVVLDVGHNPHAARWLSSQVRELNLSGKVRAVYACLSDKDSAGVMAAMAEVVDSWYITSLDVPRSLPIDQLQQMAGSVLPAGCIVQTADNVASALRAAIADAGADDCVLVFGSFYTVAEAQKALAAP
ncbi:bifunctional tetrahydrofolate synthase/dihydrofolate synthase [Marinobacter sp. BGYM27]|uniref:bifunctional tetrahydrofolate synthase/dihydrofolate synthase n=1 Tax=Marinobacter sp. BGYM27 TaxID=2975597 RepID=UPI0021A7C236|nr:bifunctional tetrahydrofolate synthase/dihydrofolate synthase [Marinobacter sp. BGYM27]MDG5499091.1 bifunctional tetrahydrofolate synthase/dihydrofolate synthase [Marinobacter sp. BGYM27]